MPIEEIVTFECPQCRAEMFDGARFCIRCGSPLDRPAGAAAPAVTAAQPIAPEGAQSVADAIGRALAAGPTHPPLPTNTMPLSAPAARAALDASLQSIDAGFGALGPTTTTAPVVAPPPAARGREDDPSQRSNSIMADHSRDEILRRVRIKQSMKRAGLAGVDLSGANLEGVDFARADLEGANLENARLVGANLKSASLRNARLTGADLSRAELDKADLEEAKLDGANLEGASLKRASLEGASLEGARLAGAKLTGAELSAAALVGAVLRGADLSYAELAEAELTKADLAGANLANANLQGATLAGALLQGALLTDADLRGAMAPGAIFDGARLERACLEAVDFSAANLANVDARHANFTRASLGGAVLHHARVAGATFHEAQVGQVHAEWLDRSPAGDGSLRVEGAAAMALLRGEEVRDALPSTRYFGKGDVLRDATLEFGSGSVIQIDSRFENCSITLGDGAELTVGESGVLKNCSIVGTGNLVVHGRFFERQSPGIAGVRSLFVSARGGIVGGVEQCGEGTRFAFEPGCRLRMKILRPRLPAAAE